MDTADRYGPVVTLVAVIGAAAAIALLHIEQNLGLPRLMPVVVVGFAIHAMLPQRFRITLFLLLGLAGALLLFGPVGAAMLIGAGLVLIGACHLPIPHRARVAVVVLLGAGFASLRVGWVEVPGALSVLPILASMFMFRLIIYLYDLPHERKPVPLQTRLAYFFMLPNLCFPLFPVVDYQRFTASYYVREADGIHRKGVGWMLLGTVHILAYRWLHIHLIPDPASIQNQEDVVLFVVTAYVQYLRISGMFHIAVGILCLFGFDLLATNRWFFFAATYTDLWRRINSYWKDFLQKTVYFPVFMRFRKKLGMTRAMVLATAAVFISSWALHAYQWFWLQGEVLISEVDLGFWGLVGAGVVVSSLVESRRRKQATPRTPLQEAVARTRSMALVFAPTAVLWSLWSSESLPDWLYIVGQLRHGGPLMTARIAAVAIAVFAGGVGLNWLHMQGRLPNPGPVLARGPVLVGVAGALVLMGVAAPRLPDDSSVLALTLEPAGAIGYYEGLIQDGAGPGQADDGVERTQYPDFLLQTDGKTRGRLRPSVSGTLMGEPFRTNEHGLRGPSVSKSRTPGVVRIALLGASPAMGWGVADGEEFPALIDRALGPSVEVVNFAMAGFGPVRQLWILEDALEFDPHLVVLVTHCEADRLLTETLLLNTLERGPPFPPDLQALVPLAELQGATRRRARIAREVEPLTRWAYGRLADVSRDHGAVPVWVFLRLPQGPPRCDTPHATEAERWARAAGLETVRLKDIFRGYDRSLLITEDDHPNDAAHRIIAEHLAPRLAPWVDEIAGD